MSIEQLISITQLSTVGSSNGQLLASNGTSTYWYSGAVGYTGSAGVVNGYITGTNTQVAFNDSGFANASANFTFDKSLVQLSIGSTAANVNINTTSVSVSGSPLTSNAYSTNNFISNSYFTAYSPASNAYATSTLISNAYYQSVAVGISNGYATSTLVSNVFLYTSNLVFGGVTTHSGNVIINPNTAIIVGGTPGTIGQVLASNGYGVYWTSISGGSGNTSGGNTTVTISDNPPVAPTAGSLWWNSSTGTMFIYYVSSITSQWVAATPAIPGPQGVGYTGSSGAYAALGYTGSIGYTGSTALLQNTVTFADNTSITTAYGLATKNRFINGSTRIDQRYAGTIQTFTTGNNYAMAVDRWYGYALGANVTGQRVSGAIPNSYRYQFYGNTGVTTIGFGQRIEAINSADMAGQTVTFAADISNSLLPYVVWTMYSAGANDTFGSLSAPFKNFIANGAFTVNNSVSRYSTSLLLPNTATNGIEVVLTVGSQTSGTWILGNLQLEVGTTASPFERIFYIHELTACQTYYEKSYDIAVIPGTVTVAGSDTNGGISGLPGSTYTTRATTVYKVPKRSASNTTFIAYDTAGNLNRVNLPDVTTNVTYTLIQSNQYGATLQATTSGGATDSRMYWHWTADSEMYY